MLRAHGAIINETHRVTQWRRAERVELTKNFHQHDHGKEEGSEEDCEEEDGEKAPLVARGSLARESLIAPPNLGRCDLLYLVLRCLHYGYLFAHHRRRQRNSA